MEETRPADVESTAPALGCGIIVIDFEALTPAGRPLEPIEVGALALRHVDGRWYEQARFSALIRPPDDVPVTSRCTALTGITAAMLAPERSAQEVLGELDRRLTVPPYRLVAHSADGGQLDPQAGRALPEPRRHAAHRHRHHGARSNPGPQLVQARHRHRPLPDSAAARPAPGC